MASRLWNQISSVKYLKNGTLRTYSSVADRSNPTCSKALKRQSLALRGSPESGIRNLSASKDLSSSVEPIKQGRFVRNAPGPLNPSEVPLRPALRYRISHGANRVSKSARDTYLTTSRVCTQYRLRDGSETVPNEEHIAALKREYQRKQTVARFQPQSMTPFCSKEVQGFEREDVRPSKFVVDRVPKRHMSTKVDSESMADVESLADAASLADNADIVSEDIMVTRTPSDTMSVYSMQSVQSYKSIDSVASSSGSVGSLSPVMPVTTDTNLSDKRMAAGPSSEKTHIGYNFTQLNKSRPFSTFSRQADSTLIPNVAVTQTRGECDDKTCEPPEKCAKKVKMSVKDCSKLKVKERYPSKSTYKHHGRWDKCECCPEMLDCDKTTCIYTYPFPCPCDNFPGMCPIDCPPPCEDKPPPPVKLCRPPKCPVYQKLKVCKSPKCPKKCIYVTPKALPPFPKSNCPCIEPPIPPDMPELKIVKKHVYQCQPCPGPPCCDRCVDNVVPPKKLPPIIPGVCPCIEPKILDVPPLKRLKMHAYQKVKQCTGPCNEKIEQPKCIERKTLPKIKSDCVCIEPEPLKPVPLVRLPHICLCPDPPDPKCYPEKCPPRADEICKWKYPKQKLKNFWCPNCKVPKTKYKWCKCHTRGHKKCHKRCMSTFASLPRCNSLLLGEGTFTIRPYSSFAKKGQVQTSNQQCFTVGTSATTGLPGPSFLNKINTTLSPLMLRRGFHVTSANAAHDPKTLLSLKGEIDKKCKKKKKCQKICGTVCCEPPARDSCKIDLPPLCCKAKRSPYPSFSECGEFSQLLTCECKMMMPYLQPRNQVSSGGGLILKEPAPKFKIIDPTPEEHCVMHDLCRPLGHTYTCETFHKGEYVPITQYECMSPHRLPCCERDQICDFGFRKSERKCDGNKKEREFYRCECACPKPKTCPKDAKQFKLDSMYSKIKKRTGRRSYSTMSSARNFGTLARRSLEVPRTQDAIPSTSAGVAKIHHTAVALKSSKRPSAKVGGQDMCSPKCRKKCNVKKGCGKPMRPSFQPGALREGIKKEEESFLSEKLKQHFRKSQECTARGRKHLLLADAKCAAKRVGMRLVADHDPCCKRKVDCLKTISGGGTSCGPLPECKRPKNVCCPCDPRYEVDECRKKNWLADCCEMPYRISGAEFRAKQPPCCKMPIPICNRHCIRVRGDCKKDMAPCCVTESPFPAFSDCHPPFKRLILNECQRQDVMAEESSVKIDKMLSPHSLKAGSTRDYSTFAKAVILPVIEEETCQVATKSDSVLDKVKSLFDKKPEGKGLHEPVNCKCSKCLSMQRAGVQAIKPDLSRDIQTALPCCIGDQGFDNIPELLFTKDDVFKQVDSENLISLAPQEMSPLEKVKCFLFNKANKVTNAAAPLNLPVDGFKCFVRPTSGRNTIAGGTSSLRRYSSSKAAEEEYPEDVTDSVDEEAKKIAEMHLAKVLPPRNVITLSTTTDLVYLLDDGKNTINFSPKKSTGAKVKVIPHPVCTHIMLDSGELLLENEYHLMNTLLPLKNRIYLPYGLSHEEYTALEQQNVKSIQEELEKMLVEKENS